MTPHNSRERERERERENHGVGPGAGRRRNSPGFHRTPTAGTGAEEFNKPAQVSRHSTSVVPEKKKGGKRKYTLASTSTSIATRGNPLKTAAEIEIDGQN